MKCVEETYNSNFPCPLTACRFWLNYKEDLNCTHIAIYKHGSLKLQEIGDRLQLTAARIKQLEEISLKKIFKKNNMKILE